MAAWEPITRWFGDQFSAAQTNLDTTVSGLIPSPPAAVVEAAPCATLSGFINDASWIGRYVPLPILAIAVGVLVLAVVAAVAIRIARIVISLGTFGGGA